jgi:hypothetical protein
VNSNFRFAEAACNAFWTRVASAASVPTASLGVFRWLYGLYFLALEAPSFTFIDLAPGAFFDPPLLSLAFLFDGFPPAPFFRGLDLLAVFALGLVTVGYRTRTATLALLALKFIGSNFQFSFGKIDHDILALAVLPCMLLGDWGRYHSLDAKFRHDEPSGTARGPALFAVLLAFGMFSAGLPKALSWIDFDLDTSGVLSWYYPQRVAFTRELLLAPYLGSLPALVLEIGDYLAALLEVAAFAALLHSRRLWLWWLLLASFFHLLNVLTLNINFMSYAVLYCCFANLTTLGPTIQRWLSVLVGAAGVMTAWHLLTRSLWVGSPVLFVAGPIDAELVSLWAALPTCVAVILLIGTSLRSRSQQRP